MAGAIPSWAFFAAFLESRRSHRLQISDSVTENEEHSEPRGTSLAVAVQLMNHFRRARPPEEVRQPRLLYSSGGPQSWWHNSPTALCPPTVLKKSDHTRLLFRSRKESWARLFGRRVHACSTAPTLEWT